MLCVLQFQMLGGIQNHQICDLVIDWVRYNLTQLLDTDIQSILSRGSPLNYRFAIYRADTGFTEQMSLRVFRLQ